jgi:DNA-binding NarL/FixJ family response regulator
MAARIRDEVDSITAGHRSSALDREGCKTSGSSSVSTNDGLPREDSRAISVLLIENHLPTAQAITRDFEIDGVSVRLARTLADARTALLGKGPEIDVVISELQLPDGRGESLLPRFEALPRQPVVIITSSALAEMQVTALEYRPIALSKPVDASTLLRIVKTVTGGYARSVLKRFITGCDLSKREAESIAFLAQGLRAKEIAGRMRCSEPTIYGHLAKVAAKAGCSDYHDVVAKLFAFACQAVGHSPVEPSSLLGGIHLGDSGRTMKPMGPK